VVVNTVVEYIAPLRLDQAPLFVSVWPTEVKAASFALGYELFTGTPDGPLVHGRATTVLAPYVFAAGRPRGLTAEERERMILTIEPSPVSDRALVRGAGDWGRTNLVERKIHVRFSDIDLLGHVNNLRYLDYAQVAHVDLLVGVFDEARVRGS